MQKLKKLAVAAMAAMLMVTPAVSVSASTLSDKADSESIDVKAKYTGGTTTPEVYSVDVTWGKMEFTYSVSGDRKWDPATHMYIDNTSASWTADGNDITVVNHSNAAVNVGFAYAAVEGFDNISGKFSVASDILDAGVVDNFDGADSVSTKLTLSGALANTAAEFTKVGSITVSLS